MVETVVYRCMLDQVRVGSMCFCLSVCGFFSFFLFFLCLADWLFVCVCVFTCASNFSSLQFTSLHPSYLLSSHLFPSSLYQGIVGVGTTGPGVGLLSAVTSAVVVHKVSSEEGIYGMYVRMRTHLTNFHFFIAICCCC